MLSQFRSSHRRRSANILNGVHVSTRKIDFRVDAAELIREFFERDLVSTLPSDQNDLRTKKNELNAPTAVHLDGWSHRVEG